MAIEQLNTPSWKVEQVEQITDRGHIPGYIRVGTILHRIWQVVATAVAEGEVEFPIPLDKLHERGMLAVHVTDVASSRERGHGDHGNARASAEEVNRLDEPGIVVTTAFVHGYKDR